MHVTPVFQDRIEAGRLLGEQVSQLRFDSKPLVLALPRGGVPVGLEVANAVGSELDIFLVRKLGLPGEEELALGAIASGGTRILNETLVRELRIPEETINALTAREQGELERREQLYRYGLPGIPAEGRTVILVDDGVATGSTMRAAVAALRSRDPLRIVVAVPIACPRTCREIRPEVDELICAETRDPFIAVGIWYQHFPQVSDREVQLMLREARGRSQPEQFS